MGFNVSQIINKFVPTKRVDDDLRENPFNTEYGQEIVSIQENFWARLNREGRPRPYILRGTDITINTDFYPLTVLSPYDCILYPSKVVASANVDGEIIVQVQTGLQDVGNIYYNAFVKAGTPFVLDFKGDVFLIEGGSIKIGINSANTGKFYASAHAIEVSLGA